MTRRERRRFFHFLATASITIKPVRASEYRHLLIPKEAAARIRAGTLSTNAFWHSRHYGRALWRRCGARGEVEIDVMQMLRRHKPMSFLIEVLIHEVCHIAFDTHQVEQKYVRPLLRSRKARAWAERRLLLALAKKAGLR